jgi:biotin-[acetyl-CoA-carboxylase] ligase BirA-like protein
LKPIITLDSVDSTQDEVIRRLKAGDTVHAVLAKQQTAGRGRFGRSWESPRDECLALSFAWHNAIDWEWPAGLALAAGLVAAQTFDTSLAWPNDLVIGGKKVGGVLSEIVTCSAGNVPVIGLGINLTQTAPNQELPWASSLVLEGRPRMMPLEAAAIYLEAIGQLKPPKTFRDIERAWRSRDTTLGKEYKLPDGRIALALYVNDEGALAAKADGELIIVSSAVAIYGKGS